MTIKAVLLKAIKDNLVDDRMLASQWYLSELIERKEYPTGIEQYRIHTVNSTEPAPLPEERVYIKSLTDLIQALTEDEIYVEFMHSGYKPNDNKVAPISVTIKNLKVDLHHGSEEDEKYIHVWGGSRNVKEIGFVLAYVCDNDTTLPLKIVNVTLG